MGVGPFALMGYRKSQLGHGIGLRNKHVPRYFAQRPPVAWVEAITENFMGVGGRVGAVLEKVRRDVPVALHGVSLSIGATDPLSKRYLRELKTLVDRIEPAIVSDHLCWGSHRGRYVHDLLPLPYTEEALRNVVTRVQRVQDVLGRQLLLENVSSYMAFNGSTMPEWEFLAEISRRADCGILLDVNNIYVSAKNHRFDPLDYLEGIPADRVGQIHLAGHRDEGVYLFDTHDGPVCDDVWALYEHTIAKLGSTPTLIEWDENVPELERLVEESQLARATEARVLSARPKKPSKQAAARESR